MATETERTHQISADIKQRPILLRLRRIQAWRRARLQRLILDPDIDENDPDRRKAIRAAQRYTAVAARANAILVGLIDPNEP